MLIRRALLYGRLNRYYKLVLEYAGDNAIPLPDQDLRAKQNLYAQNCDDSGLFERWAVKWVHACHNADFARINWKDPNNYYSTENGTLVFTANVGYRSNGTTGYLDTGWRPILDGGGLYTLDDAAVVHYVQNNVQGAFNDYGLHDDVNVNSVRINTRNASNQAVPRINDSGNFAIGSQSNSIGRWLNQRTGGSARNLAKDGSDINSNTQASTGLNTNTMFVCALSNNGTPSNFSSRNISDLSAGASLGSLAADDSTHWYTYFNSL